MITQVSHRYHAFAFMCYCFYKKSKGSNTTDDALKFFAKVILHKLYLFVFITGTFCFHGFAFPIAAMFAFLFHFLIRLQVLIQAFLQYTVHHHIGITADG